MQTFKHNLQIPKTLNSGNSSSRNDDKEETKLLTIFPVEIWQLVFRNLETSPNTLQNASKATRIFRKILLPERTKFLFSDVWSVLTKNALSLNHTLFGDFAKNVKLVKCLILSLRLTCQAWCSALDAYCKNSADYFKIGYRHYFVENGCIESNVSDICLEQIIWNKTAVKFSHDLSCTQFLNHFEFTHSRTNRCPFVFRNVSIDIDDHYNFNAFSKHLVDVLEIYGRHIWHVKINIFHPISLSNDRLTYCKLRQYFELMPNLISIRLFCNANERTFSQPVISTPMPVLSNLRYFSAFNFPTSIVHDILDKNSHIAVLDYNRRTVCNSPKYSLPTLPNLSTLATDIWSRREFELLSKWTVAENVETVVLSFSNRSFIPWSEVLQLLQNKFAFSLKHLAIKFPEGFSENEECEILRHSSACRLRLPKIISLQLIVSNCCSLDFLLPLSRTLQYFSLRQTRVSTRNSKPQELISNLVQNEVLMYLSCKQKLDGSKICQIFSCLQVASVQIDGKKLESWKKLS